MPPAGEYEKTIAPGGVGTKRPVLFVGQKIWEDIMKRPRRRFLHLGAGAVVLGLLFIAMGDHGARSQTARTIKIVNPYPPGGTADIVARILSEQIGRSQGVTMVIENRPGGGTVIGTEAVARAAPDGNTLLITSVVLVINP